MLLSKEVEIKADWASVKRYESLGYGKMRQGDLFFIKVEDLKPNSLQLVDVSCDYCNVELKRRYGEYIRNTKIQGKFSCSKCTNNKYKVTCLEKYGVDNISKLSITHDKIRETSIERYGETSYMKTDKSREENKIRTMEKYGVDNVLKSDIVRNNIKKTCLLKYGVENASQCPEIFSKQQKSRFEINNFNDTDIYYQGTYEHDFLEKYYNAYKIEKATPIEYFYDGSIRVYYPDFFLPEYNLIVEIKSIYTFEKYLNKNTAKKEKCIELGYNFIFIIDKDYKEFEYFIDSTMI